MECWSAGFGGLRSFINSIPQKFKVRLPQCRKAFKKYFMGCAARGSRKNDFTFYTPLHPARLRCKSSESVAADSGVFKPCRTGRNAKICELIFW
jgi:hypothetical protein